MTAGTTVVRSAGSAGTSPKAKLAALLPALGTLILAVLDVVLSPNIDASLKVAIVGAVNAGLAFLGAWLGAPGDQVVATFPFDDTPGLEHDHEPAV